MKKLIFTMYLLLPLVSNKILVLQSFAQSCSNEESVPDELLRKRHKPANLAYGHPYTQLIIIGN